MLNIPVIGTPCIAYSNSPACSSVHSCSRSRRVTQGLVEIRYECDYYLLLLLLFLLRIAAGRPTPRFPLCDLGRVPNDRRAAAFEMNRNCECAASVRYVYDTTTAINYFIDYRFIVGANVRTRRRKHLKRACNDLHS